MLCYIYTFNDHTADERILLKRKLHIWSYRAEEIKHLVYLHIRIKAHRQDKNLSHSNVLIKTDVLIHTCYVTFQVPKQK